MICGQQTHLTHPDEEIESLQREIAQRDALLANQTQYIKTLQDENLRLNKDVSIVNEAIRRLEDKEALIAELVDHVNTLRLALEPWDDIKPRDWKSDRSNLRDGHQLCLEILEKVNGK